MENLDILKAYCVGRYSVPINNMKFTKEGEIITVRIKDEDILFITEYVEYNGEFYYIIGREFFGSNKVLVSNILTYEKETLYLEGFMEGVYYGV